MGNVHLKHELLFYVAFYNLRTISSAKIIVYDYAANGENRIVVDSTLDTASAYDQLIKKGVSQETAEATASQILVYYTGNYSAKAIIVFKY